MSSPSSFLLSLAVLLSVLVTVVVAQTSPASTPRILYHDAQDTLPYRNYPGCVFDMHVFIPLSTRAAIPTMWQLSAADGNWNFESTIDVSTSGSWDAYSGFSTFQPNWGSTPTGRVAAAAAYLANGNLLYMGGKTAPSWTVTNDVAVSADKGNTWTVATGHAGWIARSDMSLAVQPGSNTMVLLAGTDLNGNTLDDVWMSSDGQGAVWVRQSGPTSVFTSNQQGASAFVYDCYTANPALYPSSSVNCSLVFYSPNQNAVFRSTDLGITWTNLGSLPTFANQQARMIADMEGNVLLFGGNGDTSQVYFSQDKGTSWQLVNQTQYYPGFSDIVTLSYFASGCLALRYTAATTSAAPNGFHKTVVVYAGGQTVTQNVYAFQGINPVFANAGANAPNCLASQPTFSSTSTVAELIFPAENYVAGNATNNVPNSIGRPNLVFHDGAQELPYRAYPDCAYDVHAIAQRSSTPRMWQFGGFTSVYAWINTIDFSKSGNWSGSGYTTFQPIYIGYPTANPPSGRVAAGAGLLANGNLIWFGGKDNSSSTSYNNDVYWSTDNGFHFTYAGQANWLNRSDMSVAVLPNTNTMIMVGGMYSSTGASSGAPMNDVWISTDPIGLRWIKQPAAPFLPFQDCAMVALYDGMATNSSSTKVNATILLNTNGHDEIWTSSNIGYSWSILTYAPWTLRNRNIFTADMEGYVYMSGGSNTGDVWFSWNGGLNWAIMIESPSSSVWPNTVTYQSSHDNCQFIKYTPNPNSPNGYHKTLILYGGGNVLGLTYSPAPTCVRVSTAYNVVYGEVMFPSESNRNFSDTGIAAAVPRGITPAIAFNSPTPLLTYRQYPSCAYDVHSLKSLNSNASMYIFGGWDVNGNLLSSIDRIQGTNFGSYQYIWPAFPGFQPGKVAGGSAVLSNGNLIWFGGKIMPSTSTNTWGNDVWYSTNNGVYFQRSTAAALWSPRSDMSVAALPGTNCVMFIGGEAAPSAVYQNDVWSSCDGVGASWQLQSSGVIPAEQQGAIVALFDAWATPQASILFYTSATQCIYSTNTMGNTWSAGRPAPWSLRDTARFVADVDNYVYLLGGTGVVGGDVWFSWDKGNSWTYLNENTNVGYPSPVTLSYAAYPCLFVGYTPSSTGINGQHKTLVFAGQDIEAYSTATSTGGRFIQQAGYTLPSCQCNSLTGIHGMLGDLVFPGERVNVPTTTNNTNNNNGTNTVTTTTSGSSGYSSGATAGIAVGVGVGVALLCCLMFFIAGVATRGKRSSDPEKTQTNTSKHAEFHDEHSRVEQSQQQATTAQEAVELAHA